MRCTLSSHCAFNIWLVYFVFPSRLVHSQPLTVSLKAYYALTPEGYVNEQQVVHQYKFSEVESKTLEQLGCIEHVDIQILEMTVFEVRTPGGFTCPFEWKDDLVIKQLKRILEEKHGLPASLIELKLARRGFRNNASDDDSKTELKVGMTLDEDCTLGGYGIPPESVLEVSFIGRGTPVWIEFPGATTKDPGLRTLVFATPEMKIVGEVCSRPCFDGAKLESWQISTLPVRTLRLCSTSNTLTGFR